FASRRRHTRFSRDWSSDVCSSDLSTRLWKRSVPVTRRSPGRLGEDEIGLLGLLRQDDLDLAVHVLLDEVGALGLARLVPGQRADDGLDLVGAQPVDELLLALALLGAAHGLDGGDDDLAGRVRVGLVLAGRVAVELGVALDELDVRRPARGLGVPGGRQDALGLRADRRGELG